MSVIASAIKHMLAAGMPHDAIVQAVADMEAARGDEPKRSKGAIRQARYEEKKRQKASESVRNDEPDAYDASDVRKRQVLTPLARVRDNITNSEIYTNHTTLNCASADAAIVDIDGEPLDWPKVTPPTRVYLDRLEAALREAGGGALSPISTNLMILSPILALGSPGKGPPCDLQADVLPVIRARSARAKPNSISTWGYFTEAIRQARDNRLAGAPASQEISHDRPSAQSAKFERRQASHAADFAGSELAADLRAERRARYL